MSEFQDHTVLVTGAASGIGAALAAALLAQDARVIALDRNADGLATLRETYGDDRLACFTLDVSDSAAVDAAVAAGETKLGAITKLATVAGVLQMGQIVDLSDAQWAQTFAVNTTGTFNVLRAVGARMVERGKGAVVVVSSNAATTPRTGMGAYAASKAAVTQLARCFALEVAQAGVRCNIVSPGSTDTEMQRAMWRQGSSAQTVIEGSSSAYRLGIPLGKIAQPEDIVASILFLLSDRAGHITLHDLRVDGGATLDR